MRTKIPPVRQMMSELTRKYKMRVDSWFIHKRGVFHAEAYSTTAEGGKTISTDALAFESVIFKIWKEVGEG